LEKKDKDRFVRHSSGNDKEFTIFDALLESLVKKEGKESAFRRLTRQLRSPWNIATLSLIFLGWATLTWVGQIIWTDVSLYGKDMVTILLGSRVGENISLGVDIRVIYYLIIGSMLLFSSLTIKLIKRRFN
jgi:hypothetical protein